MSPRQIVVATHGHCFDGMASAALFAHVLRRVRSGTPLAFRFLSCGYGPNMSQIPAFWLAERDAALAGASGSPGDGPQVYHDAAYGSCARLIADTAGRVFGVDPGPLAELLEWADRIDTASFDSAADAIRRDEPVLQLASVVEQHGDRAFLDAVVPKLEERGLHDVARDPWIQERWAPIAAAQSALRERFRARSRLVGRVVVTDLSDAPIDTPAKFISYALFPTCMYSVTLSRSKQHFKLAVGYNPWCGSARLHDIASICKRYGGGGHPVVGAATFRLPDEPLARAAAEDVTRELAA
jgi:hypothetical protein